MKVVPRAVNRASLHGGETKHGAGLRVGLNVVFAS